MSYDEKVLQCFLDNQLRLYPEPVAETLEEAENFLEDVCAVVAKGKKEVLRYFEEEGVDIGDDDEDSILNEAEVFDVGDGRYIIVEG